MNRNRIFLVFLIALMGCLGANAQELWLSAQGRANITKALRADIEMEHRSRDGFDATSRWSAEAALSYKCLPWLRAGVSYKFLYNRDGGKSTKKGNYIPAYWCARSGELPGITLTDRDTPSESYSRAIGRLVEVMSLW